MFELPLVVYMIRCFLSTDWSSNFLKVCQRTSCFNWKSELTICHVRDTRRCFVYQVFGSDGRCRYMWSFWIKVFAVIFWSHNVVEVASFFAWRIYLSLSIFKLCLLESNFESLAAVIYCCILVSLNLFFLMCLFISPFGIQITLFCYWICRRWFVRS